MSLQTFRRIFKATAATVVVTVMLSNVGGAPSITGSPLYVQRVLNEYCAALGSKNSVAYQSVFHKNGHPDWDLIKRQWKEHDTVHTLTKSELLFQDKDLIIVRLYTDILWRDYEPPFTSEEVSLVVLRNEESTWKVWNVSQLDVKKKE